MQKLSRKYQDPRTENIEIRKILKNMNSILNNYFQKESHNLLRKSEGNMKPSTKLSLNSLLMELENGKKSLQTLEIQTKKLEERKIIVENLNAFEMEEKINIIKGEIEKLGVKLATGFTFNFKTSNFSEIEKEIIQEHNRNKNLQNELKEYQKYIQETNEKLKTIELEGLELEMEEFKQKSLLFSKYKRLNSIISHLEKEISVIKLNSISLIRKRCLSIESLRKLNDEMNSDINERNQDLLDLVKENENLKNQSHSSLNTKSKISSAKYKNRIPTSPLNLLHAASITEERETNNNFEEFLRGKLDEDLNENKKFKFQSEDRSIFELEDEEDKGYEETSKINNPKYESPKSNSKKNDSNHNSVNEEDNSSITNIMDYLTSKQEELINQTTPKKFQKKQSFNLEKSKSPLSKRRVQSFIIQ